MATAEQTAKPINLKDAGATRVALCGSLDAAIASLVYDASLAAFNTTPHDILAEARALKDRAERATEQAAETIDQRCFRLGLMAADKDAEAERHMEAAADAAGLAAGRRKAGNDDAMASSYDREVKACTDCAMDAMAEAERLRSQAASLRRAQSYAADVVASVGRAA